MCEDKQLLPEDVLDDSHLRQPLRLDGYRYPITELWSDNILRHQTIHVDEFDGAMDKITVQFFHWPETQSVSCRVEFETGYAEFGESTTRLFNNQAPLSLNECARRAFGNAIAKFSKIVQYKMAVGVIDGVWDDDKRRLV